MQTSPAAATALIPYYRHRLLCAAALLVPVAAQAHTFTPPYTMPVPFSIYAWAASAALLLSFLVVGVFAGTRMRAPVAMPQAAAPTVQAARPAAGARWTGAVRAGRALSVGLLLLCMATGLLGTQDAYANFNMTFFWIVFVLGVPYAVAILGDFYATLNPWRVLVDGLERATGTPWLGQLRNPQRLGYAPALLLYMAFIWLELFGQLRPRGLSIALAAYTLVNLGGAWLLGKDTWFRHGEFFAVFMRLVGRMSPLAPRLAPRLAEDGSMPPGPRRWRAPFMGLLDQPASGLSLVVFVLFMLSSTAFDGLHGTLPWVTLFWKHLYPDIAPWLATPPARQVMVSTQLYYLWQWASLLVSPVVYLLVFAGFVGAAKVVTRSALPLRELVLRFALSLVPIAFVYHVTHYYTLLLAQGGQVWRLASDPFGFGWNLFGTGQQAVAPLMLDVDIIWHTQVALIVAGHIVSVYLAHVEALRCFATPRRAAASQLPMLVLMMAFTTLGLWILSLPLAMEGG